MMEPILRLLGALGVNDRDVLKVGTWADSVVFVPKTVTDTATWSEPHSYPIGIHFVIVNGVAVVLDDNSTGSFPGKVLKRVSF